MTNSNAILLYVQHLLGSGHLLRACLLARSLSDHSFSVTLVSGGMPIPEWTDHQNFRFVQLPPLQSPDLNLNQLVDQNGDTPTQDFLDQRQNQLLSLFRDVKPSVLITETYPFGRGALRYELEPLVKSAYQNQCLILSSIRDVINPPSSEKKTVRIFKDLSYYDGILVHGDPNFIPLEASFVATNHIKDKLHYTGYVTQTTTPPKQQRQPEILISAGGGRAGDLLWETAWTTAQNWPDQTLRWRFLLGKQPHFDKESSSDHITLETNRPDFLSLLTQVRLSISQCGYNTSVDLFLTQTPAIVVPFVGPGLEQEQTIRAHYLEKNRWCKVVPEHNLTPDHLNSAIKMMLDNPRSPVDDIDLNGCEKTTTIIQNLLRDKK